MTGLNLVSLLLAVFCAGAYLALLVRALIQVSTDRRLLRTTREELAPEDFDRLREYLGQIEARERERARLA